MIHWYIVGNSYVGCGHRHRKVTTARKCLAFHRRHGSERIFVWKMFPYKTRKKSIKIA